MAVYKRGNRYWYEFEWAGERIRKSTKTGNKRAAEKIEAAAKLKLALGDGGIEPKPKVPTLREFLGRVERFHADKFPKDSPTLRYYTEKSARLAESELAPKRLDQMTTDVTAAFARKCLERGWAVNTTNHCLAVLRRILRLAVEWGVISSAPPVRQLPGGRVLEEVLPRETEEKYLDEMRPDLAVIAAFVAHSSLRPSEALGLRWTDFGEVDGRAWITIPPDRHKTGRRTGKPKITPLTETAKAILDAQPRGFLSPWGKKPPSLQIFEREHRRVRRLLKLPEDLKPHGLRHTAGTRMAEAGLDTFAIAAIMGHKKITTTQRYVHLQKKALDSAAAAMDLADKAAVPTKSPTGAKRAAKGKATGSE